MMIPDFVEFDAREKSNLYFFKKRRVYYMNWNSIDSWLIIDTKCCDDDSISRFLAKLNISKNHNF